MNHKRDQLTLRMTEELNEKIEQISKSIGISKNAYILTILSKETQKAV